MKGCQTIMKFGKFSWRMSVQESGDRITVPSKTKTGTPGRVYRDPGRTYKSLRAIKGREKTWQKRKENKKSESD